MDQVKMDPVVLRAVVEALKRAEQALDRIHRLLDGVEWDSDTLDFVAEEIAATGRVIREPEVLVDEIDQ